TSKMMDTTLASIFAGVYDGHAESLTVLRGWINYFRHTQVKGTLEELDGWLRRRLRCILWRQAKHRPRRQSMPRQQGLTEDRARRSARNGQGPWWNAGRSYECGLPETLV
ncbi:MAG: group II intron maturase-specific domain-containing protein, partial [Burkholderia gladioli]